MNLADRIELQYEIIDHNNFILTNKSPASLNSRIAGA